MNNFSKKYFNRNRNNTNPYCSSPYYHNKSIYDCYISKGVYPSRKDTNPYKIFKVYYGSVHLLNSNQKLMLLNIDNIRNRLINLI